MSKYWTLAQQEIIQYRRRQPVVMGLTFLVLTAVNIPVTIAIVRIWRLLLGGWNSNPWNVLREFFVDAIIATFIDLSIWLVVALIAWAWLYDRRSAGGYRQ